MSVATKDNIKQQITVIIQSFAIQVLNGDLAYILHKERVSLKYIYKDNNSIYTIYLCKSRKTFLYITTVISGNTELLSNLTYAKVIQIVKIEINNIKVKLRGIGKC